MSKNNQFLNRLIELECPDSTARIFPSIVYSSAKGSIVTDTEGRDYVDLSAGFSALAIGHNHPEIKKLLGNYIENNGVMHGLGDVYASKPKVEFIETLKSVLPPRFGKIALSVTGSQAVEMAVKTSLLKTKKPGVITLKQGYHGLDLGAMNLTGMEKFSQPFIGWSKSKYVSHINSGEELSVVEDLITEMNSTNREVGTILVEPILGRFGGKPHPENWLSNLYALAKKYNALVIFDEVFTGLGRTGISFRAKVEPCDILCMGKAIGGGMPISAIACSNDIMSAWPESTGEALHTGTFFGHPLSCLVGKKTIEIIESDSLVERSDVLGRKAVAFLKDQMSSKEFEDHVNEIRGEGLMICVEFKEDLFGVKIMEDLKENGVILIPSGASGKSVSITPALNIPEDILFDSLSKLVESIRRIK
jgi:4-aminobutyrate aminotransferase-like enzyme